MNSSPNGRLVSFDMNSGAPAWTYDSTFGGNTGTWVDTVAAAPDNSLRATEGFFKEARVAFTLDATGLRTDDPVSGDQITFLSSARIGSRTWLGADQTTVASLGGFENVFGIPVMMPSGMSIGSPGITAFASTNIGNALSLFQTPRPSRTEGRNWVFILVWENDFTFTPFLPNTLPSLTTDITYAAQLIKKTALREIQDAYIGWPVTVQEGTAGTGDDRAIVLNHQTLVPGETSCGATNQNAIGNDFRVHQSQVDYIVNMWQAQSAYHILINNQQDEMTALKRADLLMAIGRGIGSTGAHEFAHHFLALCCDMEANPRDDLNARGTFNATGCTAANDPSTWTGYWPNPYIGLHWEPTTLKALTKCLSRGWREFGNASCFN